MFECASVDVETAIRAIYSVSESMLLLLARSIGNIPSNEWHSNAESVFKKLDRDLVFGLEAA